MSAPRRPAAGRRSGRPATRARTRTTLPRVPAASPPPVAGRPRREPRRSPLTPRAAVLALVALGLVASAALPLREYLSQRQEIGELEQAQAQTRERIAELEAEKARLQDPAYVAAEARRRLHFVLPGETAYVVLAPDGAAVAEAEASKGAEEPWYSQVWDSVEQADRPVPTPAP